MRHHWSAQEIDWLKENYSKYSIPKLTKLFSELFGVVTLTAMRSKLNKLGIKGKCDTTPITKEEETWLKLNYDNQSIVELTDAFNKRFNKNKPSVSISRICILRGLRKKPGYRHWTKEEENFLKMYYPTMLVDDFVTAFNAKFETTHKKSKIVEKAKHLGVKATYSKKEHARRIGRSLAVPIGSERYDCKRNIHLVKIADELYAGGGNWIDKKIIEWQKRHGGIPDGMHVIQLDGNTANYDEDNLMLVSAWVLHKFRIYGRTHAVQTRELMRTYIIAWQLMEIIKTQANANAQK